MAGWKSKGLCTLKLPREAHFEVIFARGFSELEQGFSSISSRFQGKNFTNLVLSYRFELWDCFARILGSFGTHLGTVLLFLREKTIEHCSSKFLGISWFFVFVFLG